MLYSLLTKRPARLCTLSHRPLSVFECVGSMRNIHIQAVV